MPYLELEGKNTADALTKASKKLGIPVEKLKYEMIDEGSKGIFNLLNNRPTKIRVKFQEPVMALIEDRLSFILKHMSIQGEVDVELLEDQSYEARITSDGMDGLLIGRKGQTLDALQHVINRLVNKDREDPIFVNLEVGGYRERRDSFLMNKALAMADRVKSSGKEITMDPMTATERKKIHMALNDDPGVKTYTIGHGPLRNVVVSPNRPGQQGNRIARTTAERPNRAENRVARTTAERPNGTENQVAGTDDERPDGTENQVTGTDDERPDGTENQVTGADDERPELTESQAAETPADKPETEPTVQKFGRYRRSSNR